MKLNILQKLSLVGALLLYGGLANAEAAAAYLFQFKPGGVITERDPYYAAKYGASDTTSRIFISTSEFQAGPTSPTSRVVGAMSARHYDTDPLRGDEWGLLDPEDPNFEELDSLLDGYVLKYGLQPRAFGSTESMLALADGTPAPASYISFKVRTDDTVLFSDVTLAIQNLAAIEVTDNVWGGIFTGTSTIPLVPIITESEADGIDLSITWPSLTVTGEELEIRIYGLKGADYGNYTVGVISGTILPPPVPEVSSSLLLLLASVGFMCRRQRMTA